MQYKEIDIRDIENIRIGNAEDSKAGTGVTVVICEKGAPTGLAVLGGGPASKESLLTEPMSTIVAVHGVVLGGGSAFGLDAAGGVMEYLEKNGIGYDTGVARVPLVVQSALYDLACGDSKVRPDKEMGVKACIDSENSREPIRGNMGVGTGATVGKVKTLDYVMKSGIGAYAVQVGDLKVGAIVVVNCFGDVFDCHTGEKLIGTLNDSKTGVDDTAKLLCEKYTQSANLFVGNTTLGCVVTNAKFDKVQMKKIAHMAHNGLVRTINPINTTADGDSVYAMSVGDVEGNMDVVGTIASDVVAEAVNIAVKSPKGAYGIPAYEDIKSK